MNPIVARVGEFIKTQGWKVLAALALLVCLALASRQTTKTQQITTLQETVTAQTDTITTKTKEIETLRVDLKREKNRASNYERTAKLLPNGQVAFDVRRSSTSSDMEVMSLEDKRESDALITDLKDYVAEQRVRIDKLEIEASGPAFGGFGVALTARSGNVKGFFQDGVAKDLDYGAGPAFGGVVGGAFMSGNLLFFMPKPVPGLPGQPSTEEIPLQATLQVIF